MPLPARILKIVTVVIAFLLIALAFAAWHFHHNGNALWQIISQQCVPGQQQNNDPSPCQRVNIAEGYVTLKDRNGPLQYLLMPVARISGIESPALRDPATANFFALAWQQRYLLTMRHGAVVPDSAISLAINSEYGRTQNQLHIHLSCLSPAVRQQLDRLTPQLNSHWQPKTLHQHRWLIRTLTSAELTQQSSFIRLMQEVPQAQQEMGKYGLALATLSDGRLALMAIERDWLRMNRASAEELQDHRCTILH
ncbi:CDP-diacylglycerol diphosphatase [Mixta theicola]|uniref:CDP-diacylglycerol pyrophosphatase n=1 Tax=Mixta theicola TaxID=1458355 RepID=A0A2K1Q6Y0_9GAMM|nr:CDP-diacylglycerol diphosphatase [Mixta theicola]PNS10790.1 CDP-diacylglycerol diphosphatase [Mixta theicola]GLR08839.1 CDP-diacylglycerol pyrophosphatase [Mixta theicola]